MRMVQNSWNRRKLPTTTAEKLATKYSLKKLGLHISKEIMHVSPVDYSRKSLSCKSGLKE